VVAVERAACGGIAAQGLVILAVHQHFIENSYSNTNYSFTVLNE